MSLRPDELALVVEELDRLLVDAVVRKSTAAGAKGVGIELRAPGQNRHLLIRAERRNSQVHLLSQKPSKSPSQASIPPFVAALRKHVDGTRLEAVERSPGGDALAVRFRFAGRERRASVIAELGSGWPNLVLLDAEEATLATLTRDRSARNLAPGVRFQPRPTQQGRSAESRAPSDSPLAALPPDGARSQYLEARADTAAALAACRDELLELRRRVRQAARRQRRKVEAIRGDRERAVEAQGYRRLGELLQSAYGRVERGARSVAVPDYYAQPPRTIEIDLDPSLDLQANIDRYFRLYRKYQSAVERIEANLARAVAGQEKLDAALAELEHAVEAIPESSTGEDPRQTAEHALERARRVVERLSKDRLLPRRPRGEAKRGEAKQPASPYREFTSKTGKRILVGKGGRHNDHLTLRVARGNDLWLHAIDWPGAHVVVRLDRKEAIDEETLLDAATLAAHYAKGSGGKGARTIDVAYTLAKNVRKPKGWPPGKVTHADARTIGIRIEPERLQRLFEARHQDPAEGG